MTTLLSRRYGLLVFLSILLGACGGGQSNASRAPYTPALSAFVLTAQGGDGRNTLTWPSVAGAQSYSLYWSTSPSVAKTNGTLISGITSPYIHSALSNGTTYYYIAVASGNNNASATSNKASATPVIASGPDPLLADQWHLLNTGQAGGTPGEDLNVMPVLNSCGTGATCRGEGVRIAVVDDGLEINHEDLWANVAAGLSYNYLDGSSDPTGGAHGTSVAGVAAARDMNGLGGHGVAPRANLVGYNFLAASTTSNEADAATRGSPDVSINTNSWGPPDGRGTLDAASSLWRTAIASGLATGRNGKGTIYTWAAGNGATGDNDPASAGYCPTCVDNSNYDGYANYRAVIAVCAVGDDGKKASYSEQGANLLACAPSLGRAGHGITTTDRTGALGYNDGVAVDYADLNYTKNFSGTSSATPAAAGSIALMLQANPNLGWRDVRLILAQSARKNDAGDSDWTTTTTTPAYHINHKYGFGVIDAQAAVALAKTWTNVGPELSYMTSLSIPSSATIPDNNATGIFNTINVTGSGINKIESIEITFSAADHARSGDLEITLTSPTGIKSILAENHVCTACTAYSGWVFHTVRHLGEAADGTWRLTVKDLTAGTAGTFQSWQLKFYGRAL